MLSIEQICRDVLEKAIADSIVKFNRKNFVSTNHAQELTSGDLIGVANLLQERIRELKNSTAAVLKEMVECAESALESDEYAAVPSDECMDRAKALVKELS